MGNAEKMLGCTTLQHNMGESFGRTFAIYHRNKEAEQLGMDDAEIAARDGRLCNYECAMRALARKVFIYP